MGEMERAVLELEKKWNETSKETIAENVKRLINECYPGQEYGKVVAELTGSNRNSVYAWFNMGRKNVKIPFLKLCRIVVNLDTTIEEILVQNIFDGGHEA